MRATLSRDSLDYTPVKGQTFGVSMGDGVGSPHTSVRRGSDIFSWDWEVRDWKLDSESTCGYVEHRRMCTHMNEGHRDHLKD